MIQILLPLTGCVTLASPGTSLSLSEDNEVKQGRGTESPSSYCQPGQPGLGQLRGERQPLRGVAGQHDRRDRNRGRARLGGSVLSRTMAGKAAGRGSE